MALQQDDTKIDLQRPDNAALYRAACTLSAEANRPRHGNDAYADELYRVADWLSALQAHGHSRQGSSSPEVLQAATNV